MSYPDHLTMPSATAHRLLNGRLQCSHLSRSEAASLSKSSMLVKWVLLIWSVALVASCAPAENESKQSDYPEEALVYEIDASREFQTVHNFGASDAWSIQFVGKNWPEASKEQIADWLFSMESDAQGNPKGIGLTAWRFNIGAGSTEQGDASGIHDEWRRAECFLSETGYDWSKQEGQQWFLKAAQVRGVEDFVGFVNSPPVMLTKNGKAWSEDGLSANLKEENYQAYADFLVEVIQGLKEHTGVSIDYLSPFNEPQWEWKCCNQEGSPWNNVELAKVARILDQTLTEQQITGTKLELTEAGQIDFLFSDSKEPNSRNNQVAEFFDSSLANYIGDLKYLAPKVAAHSYFSTWDVQHLIHSRLEVAHKIEAVNPDLEYWMSEYCVLEDNEEIKGGGRDLGMSTALYVARVIQADMLFANASAWHWWLAVSPYDYKDGLVYIDLNKENGNIYDSKLLWGLGNFSRFIRPGAKRIALSRADGVTDTEAMYNLIASAYKNENGELVVVYVNQTGSPKEVLIQGLPAQGGSVHTYVTSAAAADNLRFSGSADAGERMLLPARSIVTCLIK